MPKTLQQHTSEQQKHQQVEKVPSAKLANSNSSRVRFHAKTKGKSPHLSSSKQKVLKSTSSDQNNIAVPNVVKQKTSKATVTTSEQENRKAKKKTSKYSSLPT